MKPEIYDYLKLIEYSKKKSKVNIDIEDLFLPFDEIEADEKKGTADKAFVRVYGRHLKELFDQVKNNQNSHYLSCCNDFIRKSTFEEFKDFGVSVILKGARHGDVDFGRSEIICSKLAEIFEVNTPYVAQVPNDPNTIMSVDFMQGNESMETFGEITGTGGITNTQTIAIWLRMLDKAFDSNKKLSKLNDEKKKELRKDLIKHFIIRRFVFKDNDFNDGNIAFVHSKEDYSDMKLISFDYEYCLNNNNFTFDVTANVPKDFMDTCIMQLTKVYPDELKEVIEDITRCSKESSRINKALNSAPHPNLWDVMWEQNIAKSVNELNEKFATYTNENTMG